MFPFHQGRFQGSGLKILPPATESSFHSTKEGFKVSLVTFALRRRRGVSIPPRKVSRSDFASEAKSTSRRFHSTKEGFKVANNILVRVAKAMFPFHQGRFQGEEYRNGKPMAYMFPFHQGRFQGTRIQALLNHSSPFPFHQGRFQGQSV